MKSNPISWCEIYVQDMDRAKRFYESVFEMKLEKLESPGIDMWAFPMAMDRLGLLAHWSRWTGLSQAEAARYRTSIVTKSLWSRSVLSTLVGKSTNPKCQSVNTVSWLWFSIQREI